MRHRLIESFDNWWLYAAGMFVGGWRIGHTSWWHAAITATVTLLALIAAEATWQTFKQRRRQLA